MSVRFVPALEQMVMGAIVRDGNALGCPGWARVSVGTHEEIEFLLRKLASLEVGAQEGGEGRPR